MCIDFSRSIRTPTAKSYAYKLVTNRLGLWLFLVSDAFIFGGLLIARINLLGLTRPDLNQYLGLTVTSVLLFSSFFMNRAETAMALGNRKQFILGLSGTLALGILFLIGVIGVEWQLAPFGPGDGVEGAVFLFDDRFSCLPCSYRRHFLVDRAAQRIAWEIYGRKTLGSGSLYRILALHRCCLDFFLPILVFNRDAFTLI